MKAKDPPDPFADAPPELRVLDFWARAPRCRARTGDPAGYYAYSVKHGFLTDRTKWLRTQGYSDEQAHRLAGRGAPKLREVVKSLGVDPGEPLHIETVRPPEVPRPPRDPEIRPAPPGEG